MISVIIPAFNEARFIGETISVLEKYAEGYEDLEIIVVNNGSQDGTADVVSEYAKVKIINLTTSVTVGSARNIGVENSCGDLLVFIDADIIVTQQWWSALIAFNNSVNVLVPYITGCKVSVSQSPSWIEKNWFACLKKTSATYINSGNLICTKKAFDFVDGFDPKLRTGEDVDFCMRAKTCGIAVLPDDCFFAHHEGYPKTLGDFFRREKWHGTGDLQNLGKFFGSRIAQLSFFLVGLTIVMLIFFYMKYFLLGASVLVAVVVINLVTLLMRLKIKSFAQFFKSFFLNYVYFFARFLSLGNLFTYNSRSR
jgi:glycosyltransferase involved in cell wall biosynthesis